MIRCDVNVQIPIVVDTKRSGECSVYIPDFDMTVHGRDFVEAQAHAVMYASAVYYYNIERNVRFSLEHTYDTASKFINNKTSFVTFMCLTA